MKTGLQLGIAGLGTVGAEVARQVISNNAHFQRQAGMAVTITAVSARDADKDRGFSMQGIQFCDNPLALASMDNVDVVVELIGGSDGVALDLVEAAIANGKHVITAVSEHKCVLESCEALTEDGADVTVLPVDGEGFVDPGAVESAIREDTVLVSIMAVNNEIGVIQPLAEIGAICRENGVLLHTDAAQAAGKIELDVNAMNIDLLSISGHKMYAPKGIGALYVRRRPRARILAEISGGGQERGFRSGTLPVPLTVALGEAAAIAQRERVSEGARLAALRGEMLEHLRTGLGTLTVNGSLDQRVPGNLNVGFAGVDAEALMAELPEVAISTGSACTSASVEPSYVLKALGLSDADAGASVRIGFGRFTTPGEVNAAAEMIVEAVERQRSGNSARAAE